ncbi:MAG: DUF4157 domain-containing protein [Actinomycetales bacterium]|nr:DUF4157 domain-containing protein [Actinomycetales bacterium]
MSDQPEHVHAERGHAHAPAADSRRTTSAPARPAPVLTVGRADDPMERLADSLADRVVADLDASEPHRHSPGCGHLRRSVAPTPAGAVGLEGGDLDVEASSAIEAARGGGRALPAPVRRRMEGAFGTSLGHVRVHDGPQAARLSAAMQASAFTVGSDVFFGAGQLDPSTREGEHVLAHELAHVVTEGPRSVRRIVIRRKPGGWLSKVKSGISSVKSAVGGKIDEVKERRATVKKSQEVEKAEQEHLKKERERGQEGRAIGTALVWGDPSKPPADEQERLEREERLKDFGRRFETLLQAERDLFAELKEKYGDSKPEEDIAQEAYDEIWLKAPEDMRAVRPARETRAERLVNQVRQVQSGGEAQQASVDDVAARTTVGGMLSKTVERAYEHMVVEAKKLIDDSAAQAAKAAKSRKKPKKPPKVLTEAEARTQVRKLGLEFCKREAVARKHKKPRVMPEPGSRIDDAAWEQAKERVELRELKAEQDKAAIERLQTQLGVGEDAKERAKDTDPLAGTSTINTVTGIAGTVGDLSTTGGEKVADAPTTMGKIKAFFTGGKAPEKRKRDDYDTPEGALEQTTDGAQAAGGVVTKLAAAVNEGLALANHVKAAVRSKDPWEAVKATKAGLGSVNSLVGCANESAKLARSIEPSLSKEVAGVIPGFGVATAVIDTVRATLDVAMAGRRMHETDTTLFEARARTTETDADVLIWPMLKMAEAHTKTLENNVWVLGKSIFDLGVAIAELGTAGAAKVVKLVGSVVDKVHTLGHKIADEILTARAKRAKKESSVLHLEGAAQDELRMHPKMAVDAIIVQAVHGDEKAMAYLTNYWVDGKQVTPELVARIDKVKVGPAAKDTGKVVDPKDIAAQDTGRGGDDIVLIKIRNAILAEMNTEADPRSIFDKLRAGVAQARSGFGYLDKWKKTGEMAETRNKHAMDTDYDHTLREDRGFLWRVKMMLKSEEKFNRSVAKTQVLKDADAREEEIAKQRRVRTRAQLPDDVSVAIGPHKLGLTPSPEDVKAMFAKATDKELTREIERTPPRNSAGWIDLMREELKKRQAERAKRSKAKGKKAKASNPAPQGAPSSTGSSQKVGA